MGALFIPINFMISNLSFVLLALDIARSEKYSEEYSSIIFMLMIFLYLAIYVANAYFVCFLHRKGDEIEIKHFSILCVIFFSIACFLIHFDRGKQLPRYILYPLHFIEHPRDANWYTIDTRFWAPNNLSIEEIKI